MKNIHSKMLSRTILLFAAIGLAILFPNSLKADVVILQNGAVITGNILQQDANGVLLQMEYGTFRYPLPSIRDVKKEAAAAPHVANNGLRIPDWAQLVSMLANEPWADGVRQVPATVIDYGKFNSVPYISFHAASSGYELNIFGDLNQPAAIQIGAINFLKDDAGAKSNCVNFICAALANASDRKTVRSLDWTRKDLQTNDSMAFDTLLPGEWGSYGGWWVTVYNPGALAAARASAAELLALAQPRVPMSGPPPASAQIVTNYLPVAPSQSSASAPVQPAVTTTTTTYAAYGYGTTYSEAAAWSREELNAARPAVPPATYPAAATTETAAYSADTAGKVYPRTYSRAAGTYGAYPRR